MLVDHTTSKPKQLMLVEHTTPKPKQLMLVLTND